jgi:hypothetical protein
MRKAKKNPAKAKAPKPVPTHAEAEHYLHRYSLTQAARAVGIDRHTLKRWLAECAIVLPTLARGSKVMLKPSQIELAIRKHGAAADWTLIRTTPKRVRSQAA